MGLPRGRRWVDRPRKPGPSASTGLQMARLALMSDVPAANDLIAARDQLHRDAESCNRRQAELRLTVKP